MMLILSNTHVKHTSGSREIIVVVFLVLLSLTLVVLIWFCGKSLATSMEEKFQMTLKKAAASTSNLNKGKCSLCLQIVPAKLAKEHRYVYYEYMPCLLYTSPSPRDS